MDQRFKESMQEQGINAVGYIDHLEEIYTKHRIFIAPLLSGAGIKGKVINALSYGIPTILTPTAAEGIGLRHGYDCLIAGSPQEWADAIKQLTTMKLFGNPFPKHQEITLCKNSLSEKVVA